MKQILVYGDSMSWGIRPGTRERLPFDQRWPGVMQLALDPNGRDIRVIEDSLNGRRTAWDDPFRPGRNGLQGLAQRIEINAPLALVILALGTNDFQAMHPLTPALSAHGIAALSVPFARRRWNPACRCHPCLSWRRRRSVCPKGRSLASLKARSRKVPGSPRRMPI